MNGGSLLGVAYRATQRTEARRVAAREAIVSAAHALIAHGGYRDASIAAVAREAGVATGTVYRHFPSKEDLLVEVFRRASQREVDAVTTALADGGVAAGVEAFARRALAARRLAWALLAEPVDPTVDVERLAFRRAFRDAFAAALPAHVTERELVSAAIVGAVSEALVGPLAPVDVDVTSPADVTSPPTRVGGTPPDPVPALVAFTLRAISTEEPIRC
jgi:AcrR family transcriptional regulator